MSYDSTEGTLEHINRVRTLLGDFSQDLFYRGLRHDSSKLEAPEKAYFDKYTPMLRVIEYDSDEYRAILEEMKPGIDHHYAHNDHHPQYHLAGIDGMTLMNITEMMMDWKAASERHGTGDFMNSLVINKKRFNISDQLFNIMVNTARELGWIT